MVFGVVREISGGSVEEEKVHRRSRTSSSEAGMPAPRTGSTGGSGAKGSSGTWMAGSPKGLWIKITANPFPHLLMLVVVGITNGFQEIVVAGDATAVLRRTTAFTVHTDRIRKSRFRR